MSRSGAMPVRGSSSRRRLRWLGILVVSAGALAYLGFRVRSATTEARSRAIRSAIDQARWGDAESLLADWVERNPDDGRAWLKLGSVRGMLRREKEAGDAFRRVRPDEESWAQAQTLLGELAMRRSDSAEAEQAYRNVAERDPKATLPRIKLAFLLMVQRRTDEARA